MIQILHTWMARLLYPCDFGVRWRKRLCFGCIGDWWRKEETR